MKNVYPFHIENLQYGVVWVGKSVDTVLDFCFGFPFAC